MDNDRPVALIKQDDKHGLAQNAYENTIRDLNRTIYNLYIRINELKEEIFSLEGEKERILTDINSLLGK